MLGEKEVCPLCGGDGRIVTSSLTAYLCQCKRLEKVRSFLGLEIRTAQIPAKSPLYEAAEDLRDEPLVDRTVENLFIKSRWHILLGHLKFALAARYWRAPFTFLMVTDERLFNVWIGHEKRKTRDESMQFDSLRDMVLPVDLLIVRLGFFGHKNASAPGVLKTALMIRETELRPTWLVQSPNPSHTETISWNEDVEAYVRDHFDVVDFLKGVPEAPAPGLEVHEHEQQPKVKTTLPDLVPSDPVDFLGQSRQGRYKPGSAKKRWGKNGGKSGGGGGPLEGVL